MRPAERIMHLAGNKWLPCAENRLGGVKTILFAALTLLSMLSCARQEGYVAIKGYAQGGVYTIKCKIAAETSAPGGDVNAKAESIKNAADSVLNVIDRAVSGYNKTSLLSLRNSGEDISGSAGLPEYAVLRYLDAYSDSLNQATDGAFDARAAALYDAWGFGFKNGEMPSDLEVAAARADRSKSNFNAVAQGYSADAVAALLAGYGINDYLVDIGGEMACAGKNPKGHNWTIAIDTPEDNNCTPGAKTSAVFEVEGRCGVVTSGNYRKFYVRDGVKYSHTVDPRSGRPVTHNLLSATIVARDATLADALATYCMVIGFDAAREFILGRSDLEGCLISSEDIWFSPGMKIDK